MLILVIEFAMYKFNVNVLCRTDPDRKTVCEETQDHAEGKITSGH